MSPEITKAMDEDNLDKNKKLFPQKLWELIHDERYQSCLHWSDDGHRVYLNREEFEENYLKKPDQNQFNTQKAISFVRQMNMYGFKKVDDFYYENENFKRDSPDSLKRMIRRHPARNSDFIKHEPLTNNEYETSTNQFLKANNFQPNVNNNNNNNNNNSNNIYMNANNNDNHTTLATSMISITPTANRTPSPAPTNNRFIHNLSNNGSLSSTSSPSPSPSIDNNSINNNINHMINGHNFQQELSNMVLNLSNQANNQFDGNNNTNHRPIKYENHQMNDLLQLNQVSIPIDIHLELRHQYEMQQKLANQLPPVSPLTKKLVSEICSKRNALMDQSALMDAARYTENFLNVLLDDASLIAQHSAGVDPDDNSNQPACSFIDASSLTLALKLLPSKLLSSLQIYNKQ